MQRKTRGAPKRALPATQGPSRPQQRPRVTDPDTHHSTNTVDALNRARELVSGQSHRESGVLREGDARFRASLLAGDPRLKRQHTEVVGGGIISEYEFWESRRALVAEERARQQQQPGLPTQMLSELQGSVRGNQRKYKLTPAIIHQIFVENPEVQSSYMELVPDRLTENEFWVKYFQCRAFYGSGGNRGAAGNGTQLQSDGNSAAASALEELGLKKYRDQLAASDSSTDARALYRSRDVDPSVDLTANNSISGNGFGMLMSSAPTSLSQKQEEELRALRARTAPGSGRQRRRAGASAVALPVVQRVNRHGELVIHPPSRRSPVAVAVDLSSANGSGGGGGGGDVHQQDDNFSDLRGENAPPLVLLHISNNAGFFKQSESTRSSEPPASAAQAHPSAKLAAVMSAWQPDLTRPLRRAAQAHAALLQHSSNLQSNVDDSAQLSQLPEELRLSLQRCFMRIAELLRHFWAAAAAAVSAPAATNNSASAAASAKAARLVSRLGTQYEYLQSIRDAAAAQQRQQLGLLLNPALLSIDRAISEYAAKQSAAPSKVGVTRPMAVPMKPL